MARKGWDNLSDSYRNRLVTGGISKSDYESGAGLHDARGHTSQARESFASRTARFAKTYDFGREKSRILHGVRHLGIKQGSSYMDYQRKMTRLYESGDTDKAREMWENRDQSVPDFMYWYHGVFGG